MFLSFLGNFVLNRSVKGKGADLKLALLRCSFQGIFFPALFPLVTGQNFIFCVQIVGILILVVVCFCFLFSRTGGVSLSY
jgi:hypothetical protein